VIEEPGGSYYLLTCFSHPGTTQPTIAANGDPQGPSEYAAHHVTYGCYKSALISLLPTAPGEPSPGTSGATEVSGTTGSGKGGVAGTKETLTLPSAKKCVSGRRFPIHLREPRYDPFKTVTITLRGRKVASKRKGEYVVATIDLRKLPKGAFTISVHATTVLGHHLAGRRTYHTCISKLKPKKFKRAKAL
jgi:hypothetical protein